MPEADTVPPRADGSRAGIRVLDLSRILTGFTCTRPRTELWAEVIEVKRPLGACRAEAAT